MASRVRTYLLNFGNRKQAIDMPKRARVLHVYPSQGGIAMDAVQEEDADTRAFDVSHQRYFEVIIAGGAVPEGSHVGSVAITIGGKGKSAETNAFHVYEVRGR